MKSEFRNFGALLGLLFMAMSWLIPNKAYPWLPAWNEGMGFAAIFILWLAAAVQLQRGSIQSIGVTWPLLVFCVLSVITALVQFFFGLLLFFGDAFLVFLYLATFLLAVHTGSIVSKLGSGKGWIEAFAFTVVISAVFSVGFSMIQWTKTWEIAIFLLETDFGDRPGANLGQTNNLNTLLFMAFCCSLFLYHENRLKTSVLIALGLFLVWGMSITQSRTGLVQMLLVVLVAVFVKKSIKKNLNILFFIVLYFVFFLIFSFVQNKILLSAGEGRDFSMSDARLIMWPALLDASWLRPWTGYGWLQTGWAQQVTAESHPILRTYMSYSHNLALDLVIWTGWPMGLTLFGLIVYWLLRHFFSFQREGGAVFLYLAVVGVLVHGLLEYPLAYAYFLLPVGLIIGYLDGRQLVMNEIRMECKYFLALVLATLVVYFIVCVEYIQAVSVDVAVRMRSAQIGRASFSEKISVDFLILNQLSAMYKVRLMSEDEYLKEENIALIAKVAQRYPYSPALFQYAQAAAMQGDFVTAEKQLRVLCGIYSHAHCDALTKRWSYFQGKYPGTVGNVAWPKN